MADRPVVGEAIPDGWRPDHWLAFTMLAEGATQKAAAEAVDRSRGTINGWVRKWREQFGDDVIPKDTDAGMRAITSNPDRDAWRLAGGLATKARHTENRSELAVRLGYTSDRARAAALAGIEDLLSDPGRVSELDPKGILDLARAAEILARQADRYEGIASADTTARVSVGASLSAAPTANVDLSALERTAAGGGMSEVFAAVDVVWRQFREDVIDVEAFDDDDIG